MRSYKRPYVEQSMWILFRGYGRPIINTSKRINLVDDNNAEDPRDGWFVCYGKDDACFAEGCWREWVSFAWAVIRLDMYLRLRRLFRKRGTP